jgi:hypothetical protein
MSLTTVLSLKDSTAVREGLRWAERTNVKFSVWRLLQSP